MKTSSTFTSCNIKHTNNYITDKYLLFCMMSTFTVGADTSVTEYFHAAVTLLYCELHSNKFNGAKHLDSTAGGTQNKADVEQTRASLHPQLLEEEQPRDPATQTAN